jgi:hypothetical protein
MQEDPPDTDNHFFYFFQKSALYFSRGLAPELHFGIKQREF